MKLLCVVFLIFLTIPSLAFGSENCVEQYKGICRDTCSQGEIAAEGAFIDCDEKQECCVADSASKKPEADANPPGLTPANGSALSPVQGK